MKNKFEEKFPEFSVLMSVYVKEKPKYLDESLKSINNQTVFPKEIILVEDGPLTEKLYDVVQKYKVLWKSKLKIVKISKNSGLGIALREGSKYVSTNWIARMDTDDICVLNRFELQLKAVLKYPEAVIIGGQVDEFVDSVDNLVGMRHVPLDKKGIYNFAEMRNPFNHPTVFVNKRALLKVGNYRAVDKLEDYDLWIRFISNNYYVINLNKVLVHMRSGESLYQRRGGIKYFFNYVKAKNSWRKLGVGTRRTVLLSDLSMGFNIIVPNKLRKFLYQQFLHNKKR